MQKEIQSCDSFHARHFLHNILQEEGHDVAWLAACTGRDAAMLGASLGEPNMDAEQFVRKSCPCRRSSCKGRMRWLSESSVLMHRHKN